MLKVVDQLQQTGSSDQSETIRLTGMRDLKVCTLFVKKKYILLSV